MRSIFIRAGWLFILLVGFLFPASAADDALARLILFVPVESPIAREFFIKNADGKVLYASKWKSGIPFFRELALPKANYKINFVNTPIASVTIGTALGLNTFLEFGPYVTQRGDVGVQIRSWRGSKDAEIEQALYKIKEAGDEEALREVKLPKDEIGNALFFSTDPPWPNPFETPKPPPPQK